MKTSNMVMRTTREAARKFIREAKQLGITGFSQPIRAYGVWFTELQVKPKEILSLNKTLTLKRGV